MNQPLLTARSSDPDLKTVYAEITENSSVHSRFSSVDGFVSQEGAQNRWRSSGGFPRLATRWLCDFVRVLLFRSHTCRILIKRPGVTIKSLKCTFVPCFKDLLAKSLIKFLGAHPYLFMPM